MKFVVSDLARRCGGMPTVISLLCDALPFVDRPQWKPVETLVEYLVDVPVTCTSAELRPCSAAQARRRHRRLSRAGSRTDASFAGPRSTAAYLVARENSA